MQFVEIFINLASILIFLVFYSDYGLMLKFLNKLQNKLFSEFEKKFFSFINFDAAKLIEKIYFRYASTIHFIFSSLPFQKFEKYKIYNLKFNIPTNTEFYLEYRYGKKWRKKNKNYRICDGKMTFFYKLNFFSEIDKYRRGVRFKQKKIDLSDTRKKITSPFILSLQEIKTIKSKDKFY